MNYYNEFDPFVAQWLRNLIAAGLIPAGHVDTRSIVDVEPSDLAGYRQCHFFAGIGGWSLAARLAGWPDDRELWTGSAPCQPFSVAGKGKAQADDRHLWPHLFRLARARRPAVLMGEQVAAAVGKDWIDGVFTDLEGIGYACGASVVPACAVDAPHRRDRLWFVAHADNTRLEGQSRHVVRPAQGWRQQVGSCPAAGVLDCPEHSGSAVAYADGIIGQQGSAVDGGRDQRGCAQSWTRSRSSDSGGAWSGAGWIIGHDGKARRIEPSIPLLAHGLSGRVAVVRPGFEGRAEDPDALHWYSRSGALKAFGNAIVPAVAAEVIGAYMDCYPEVA